MPNGCQSFGKAGRLQTRGQAYYAYFAGVGIQVIMEKITNTASIMVSSIEPRCRSEETIDLRRLRSFDKKEAENYSYAIWSGHISVKKSEMILLELYQMFITHPAELSG